MKETGVLFTPENIRKVMSGDKTQTRRIANVYGEGMHNGKKLNGWDLSSGPFQLTEGDFPVWRWQGKKEPKVGDWAQYIQTDVDDNVTFPIICPYGVPGNLLYVKEGVIINHETKELVGYYLDGCRSTLPEHERRTAMFMAKRYARTWLELIDVRVQRLQDISEEDAKAEGCCVMYHGCCNRCNSAGRNHTWPNGCPDCLGTKHNHRIRFQRLWDSINKKTHPWSANDWVWAYTFRRIER